MGVADDIKACMGSDVSNQIGDVDVLGRKRVWFGMAEDVLVIFVMQDIGEENDDEEQVPSKLILQC